MSATLNPILTCATGQKVSKQNVLSRISDNSELSSLHVLLLKVALFKFQIFIALTLLSFLGPFQHIVLSQPAVCFT